MLLSYCSKETNSIQYDERGAITSMPWLWRVSMTNHDYNGGFINFPVYYNNSVLLGAENDEGINFLRLLDLKDGNIIWNQDYIEPVTLFEISNPYIVDNSIIIRDGYDLFKINLNTGEYNWRMRDERWGFNWLSGIDSLFFTIDAIIDPITNYPIISASFGKVENGELDLFLIPNLGEIPEPDMGKVNMAIGGFRYLKPFKNNSNNEIMLLCYYDKQYYLLNSEEQISKSYLGLYNFSAKAWVYERVELGDYNFLEGFTPTVIGDRVYHTLSGGVAECRNLYTGDLIWRNEDDYQYSWMSFIIVGNKMIVLDDLYEYLIAYDIIDGHEIWRTKSSSTIDYMQELNGIVYFRCAADGRIHAVEAETGKYIWHLISPDKKDDVYNNFMRQCTVVPGKDGEKGRVVVSSFTHAYCYEAAR